MDNALKRWKNLKVKGKIRYWGISLNTFNPYPEAEFLINKNLADGFQLVLNIINQRSLKLITNCFMQKVMELLLEFHCNLVLLTGKFNKETRFCNQNDHRYFRLKPEFLSELLDALDDVWYLSEKYNVDKSTFALSFILNHSGVSTVIPGIKTPEQAEINTKPIITIRYMISPAF